VPFFALVRLILVCWLLGFAGTAAAQSAQAPAPNAEATPSTEPVPNGYPARSSDAALQAEPAGIDAPKEPSLVTPAAEQAIAAVKGPVERILADLSLDAAAVRANWRRLGGIKDFNREAATRVARELAPSLIISLVIAVGGRIALFRVFRGIGHAGRNGGPFRKAGLIFAKFLLDMGIILLAFVGVVAAGTFSPDNPGHIAYVTALLVAGTLISVVRATLSPAAPELRIPPMSDATARYWTWRLAIVVILISFGEIFVPVALRGIVTPITARGVTVAIYVIAIFYLIWLVARNRAAPARHFGAIAEARADELETVIVAGLARYWHWPVLAGLLFLMHQVVTAGASGVPVMVAAAQILAAIAIASLGFTLLDGLATHGVTLSASSRRVMPKLEARVNAFIPPFVRVMRYVLVVIWLLLVLQLLGIAQFLNWAEDRLHIDLIGTTTRLIATALIAFSAWLAVDGWVDFRLTPGPRHVPTARERTLLTLLRNAAAVVIIVLALYSALSDIGISLAPLLASAGVLALAISWG
jgi:small conductance mechanosensitive channel